MTKQVQIRRGTATQHTSFTGAEGEISINTTNDTVHVHDGLAAGGVEMARSDLGNVLAANVAAALAGSTLSSITLTTADINGGTIDSTIIGNTTPAAGNFTSGSFTGNLSFGDNAKAIFGAGSDLQIYHDGSNSIVKDNGTGNLELQGSSWTIVKGATSGTWGIAHLDGAQTNLYHNGSLKLATTATGIDVTGTVTADGLTVDGEGRIEQAGSAARLTIARTDAANSASSASLDLMENNAANLLFGDVASFGYRLEVDGSTNKFNIISGNQTATTKRFSIDRDTGDISFYEDTGTTAKLFWDASAERLGLGTSSPIYDLQIGTYGSDADSTLALASTTTGTGSIRFGDGTSGGEANAGKIVYDHSNNGMQFHTVAAERMRITSAGDVLISTTSNIVANSSTSSGTSIGSGLLESARAGVVAQFNRQNSDGSVIDIQRSGTTVGSIGVISSRPYISTDYGSDSGLRFDSAFIAPCTTTGSGRDNAIDLGDTGNRFKSLYLSSDLVLGAADGYVFGNTNGVNIRASSGKSTIFDTAGSERLRIDASGNVGIGTSSVNSPAAGRTVLEVNGSSTALLHLGIGGSAKGQLYHSGSEFRINSIGTEPMTFYANGSERFRIDASGRVGIGTSPDASLHIVNSSFPRIEMGYGGGSNADHRIAWDSAGLVISADQSNQSTGSSYLVMAVDGTERMRIDSSGSLNVARTGYTSLSTNGFHANASGWAHISTSGEQALYVNRNTSDGAIVQFSKDGTTVGSIGVNNANNLYIGSNATDHTGLEFGNDILPRKSNSTADNLTNLGSSSIRFANLHLGGGVYLGGTGDANKLDDYEEGTWTPIAQDNAGKVGTWDSTLTGVYTKIGRLVHVSFKITGTGMQLSATGYSRYSGLPFAVAERQSGAWASLAVTSSFGGTTLVDTDESIYLYNSNNAAASSNLIASSFTYYTT